MKIRPLRVKKGGFEDSFFVIAVLFAVVIFTIILAKTWGDVKGPLNTGLQSAMPDNSPVNVTVTLDQVSDMTVLFDKLLPFLFIGLFGFVLIGASVYTQHNIMLFVGIVIVAVTILLGAIYSNIYHQIAESDEFASTTDNFKISDKYMEFLPYILFIMFVGIGALIMWMRKGGGVSL